MKVQTIVSEVTVGTILFLGLPYVLIQANTLFSLPVFESVFLKPLGVMFIFFGGTLFLYCSKVFSNEGRGTPSPTEPTENLVTTGPYAVSRNPMYISYITVFLGEFLLLGHLTLLIYLFLMIAFINYFVRKIEEPELLTRFGEKYADYQKRVPRFIGWHGTH